MSRSEADILTGMETLLANPAAWTKFHAAADDTGDETYVHDDDAKCFCLLGAKSRIIGKCLSVRDVLDRNVRRRLAAAARALFPSRIPDDVATIGGVVAEVNDHPETTHADVIEIIRLARAIEA